MRWLYLAIVVVFVAALIIFVFQNTESVSVSFLTGAITLPLALVVFVRGGKDVASRDAAIASVARAAWEAFVAWRGGGLR